MIITKKHLSRRTFLQGTFRAAVALPFLDAMMPALTAQSQSAAAAPFRFGVIYMPCGVYPETWHPASDGANFEFKPVMQPVEPFRDQLVTISKLKAPWGESVHVGATRRSQQRRSRLSRSGTGDSFNQLRSKTLDQFIADKVAGDTPMRSIEVGTEDMGRPPALDGFPCPCSRRSPGANARRCVSINPASPSSGCSARTARSSSPALKEKQSLLDSMTAETSKLRSFARADKAIATILSGSRRSRGARSHGDPAGTLTGNPGRRSDCRGFDDHMTVTYDMMHLALQGDISRVFTFMIGHEPTDRSYAHIGVPETHHCFSHHGNDPEKLAKYAKIGTYQMVKFGEFLEKVKNTKDAAEPPRPLALLLGQRQATGTCGPQPPPTLLVGGATAG
jgi:hypothetical protein